MALKASSQAHLSLEPAPTPAPLLEMDTVASSKLHEDAADTNVAPESRREDTKLLRTLIFAVQGIVDVELLLDGARGHVLRSLVGPQSGQCACWGGSSFQPSQ